MSLYDQDIVFLLVPYVSGFFLRTVLALFFFKYKWNIHKEGILILRDGRLCHQLFHVPRTHTAHTLRNGSLMKSRSPLFQVPA